MKITHNKYDGHSLIIIEGTLNKNVDAAINEIILNTPKTEKSHLWIDCSNLKEIIRINYGFSDFINYLLQLKSQGNQIVLFGLKASTRKILELLKLNDTFKQVDTLDDAYLTLRHTLSLS
jgi:anti-anti-sigma regulatory factor